MGATKLQKLAAGEKNSEVVRRRLQRTAKSLGIRVTVPRKGRTRNYSFQSREGTYTVLKCFSGKIVNFAHGTRSEKKAKALGAELQKLAAVEIDPEKVRRRLQSTAKELDIELTV